MEARKKRVLDHIEKKSDETSYEKQKRKKKTEYHDTRKRID